MRPHASLFVFIPALFFWACSSSDSATNSSNEASTHASATSSSTSAGGSGGGDAGMGAGGAPDPCGAETSTPDPTCGTLAWAVSPIQSRPRNHHTTHAIDTPAGSFLYVMGGFDGQAGAYANVDRAPIAADGSLGAFVSDTPLPVAMGGHVSAAVGETFVVAGGMANVFLATTYVAARKTDGSIGAWSKGPVLPHPRMHGGAFTNGNDVYVLGGFADPDVWDDVLKATLTPEGTLTAWESAGTLPGPRSHFTVSLIDGFIYMTGGLDKSAEDNPPNLKDVVRARLATDGTLVEWTPMPSLPVGLATHAAFFYGGYLYVGGGIDDTPKQSKVVYRAALGVDHTLGAWETSTSLPLARSHVHQLPLLHDHVYSVSGSIDFNLDSTKEIAIGSFK